MSPTNEPNDSTKQVIDECARAAHAGGSFGDSVMRLAGAGIEAYHADYRRGELTYYLPSGATYSIALHAPDVAVASAFDADEVRASIRGAQRGEVKYPEFVRRTMLAGCVGYIVWISGRHVRYFGRKGEDHVEPFPSI
jgi:uncharacterized protein YbcV (DUF1398 family)